MEFRRVSEAVIRRMPKYYRQLTVLRDQGMERISSGRLAQMMRLNASQVRQDFNCFGGFGQQGYGYNVNTLLAEIKTILAITHPYNAIIVGAGNIGTALANFDGFEQEGFIIKALFDVKEELLGTEIDGKPVYHIDDGKVRSGKQYHYRRYRRAQKRCSGDCRQNGSLRYKGHMELCPDGRNGYGTG